MFEEKIVTIRLRVDNYDCAQNLIRISIFVTILHHQCENKLASVNLIAN